MSPYRPGFIALLIYSLLISSPSAFAFFIPKPVPGESQEINLSGSTVIIKGTTHQSNKAFINGRETVVQPDGVFQDELLIPLGETEMVVVVQDPEGKTNEYRKRILAKENSFFLAGIADGTLNFSDTSENFYYERDTKRFKRGFRPDGKLSYYSTAKLHGKYLFKSSLDTDKSTQDKKLFTYIDPDEYYPIYGDNSTVVYDVNSQGKFYGLFEWEKSGAVFGNYQTQIGDEDTSKLLTYNRTLYGAKVHLETPKRTVYGDPLNKTDLFIAEANQHTGHVELLATGGSLYFLRHRNIVEGGEQVRLEVRDKISGQVIETIPQSAGTDYEIKLEEGYLIFKRAIDIYSASDTITSTSVQEGNPVYVVVNYEYRDQDAFPISPADLDDRTGGLRFSQQLNDTIRMGVTYLKEKKEDLESYDLLGGDTTIKLGNFTQVNAEFARSDANSSSSYISYNGGYDYSEVDANNLKSDSAFRVHANSSLGEYFGKQKGFLDFSGYFQRIGDNFAPSDSLFQAGTEKSGIEIAHEITKNDQVKLSLTNEELRTEGNSNPAAENQIQASRVVDLISQWAHRWKKFLFTTEYRIKEEKGSRLQEHEVKRGRADGHLLAERIAYDVNKDVTVFAGQQFGLSDMNDSLTTLGAVQKINDLMSLHAEAGAGPLGNSVKAGVEKTVNANESVYSSLSRSRSASEGKTSIFSFGSNSRISNQASLRKERQFVSSDTRGTYAADLVGYEHQVTPEFAFDTNYQRRDERKDPQTLTGSEARDAATVRLSYIQPDVIKAFSKTEYRLNSNNLWQTFLDNQAEYKVTRDLYLFGEYEYSAADGGLSWLDKKQVGVAFRPVNFDWFNALLKYIRHVVHRPQDLTSADGGFLEMNSQSDVIAAEYALDLPWHFQFVQKLAWRDEEILAVNPTNTVKTPDDLNAWLFAHRINYHLKRWLDVALEYRRLQQHGASIRETENGLLAEFVFWLHKNIGIGAGYNFSNIDDSLEPTPDTHDARGFFLRLQGKY